MHETKAPQRKFGEANKTAIINYKGAAEKGEEGRQLGIETKKKDENQPNREAKAREEGMAAVAAARGGKEKPPLKKINS